MSQPRASHSPVKIPFSLEERPSVSKLTIAVSFPRQHKVVPKLPPPPGRAKVARIGNSVHDFQIPLPPCVFPPPYYRTIPKKGLIWRKDHDPFLAAYKICTKVTKGADGNKRLLKTGIKTTLRNIMSFFSCTRSCAVRDNSLVRVSYLPRRMDSD